MKAAISIKSDPKAKAHYIRFTNKPVRDTKVFNAPHQGLVNIDLDDKGNVIGIEIIEL